MDKINEQDFLIIKNLFSFIVISMVFNETYLNHFYAFEDEDTEMDFSKFLNAGIMCSKN